MNCGKSGESPGDCEIGVDQGFRGAQDAPHPPRQHEPTTRAEGRAPRSKGPRRRQSGGRQIADGVSDAGSNLLTVLRPVPGGSPRVGKAPEPAGAAGDRVRAIGRKRLAPSSGPANSGLTLGAFQLCSAEAIHGVASIGGPTRQARRSSAPGRRPVDPPPGNARGWLGEPRAFRCPPAPVDGHRQRGRRAWASSTWATAAVTRRAVGRCRNSFGPWAFGPGPEHAGDDELGGGEPARPACP